MGEMMEMPTTIEEFLNDYAFPDKNHEYTNGSMLIPLFRVRQALWHYFREQMEEMRDETGKGKT